MAKQEDYWLLDLFPVAAKNGRCLLDFVEEVKNRGCGAARERRAAAARRPRPPGTQQQATLPCLIPAEIDSFRGFSRRIPPPPQSLSIKGCDVDVRKSVRNEFDSPRDQAPARPSEARPASRPLTATDAGKPAKNESENGPVWSRGLAGFCRQNPPLSPGEAEFGPDPD